MPKVRIATKSFYILDYHEQNGHHFWESHMKFERRGIVFKKELKEMNI